MSQKEEAFYERQSLHEAQRCCKHRNCTNAVRKGYEHCGLHLKLGAPEYNQCASLLSTWRDDVFGKGNNYLAMLLQNHWIHYRCRKCRKCCGPKPSDKVMMSFMQALNRATSADMGFAELWGCKPHEFIHRQELIL